MTESLTDNELEDVDAEFEDAELDSSETGLATANLDLAALAHPVVLRSIVGVGLAIAIVIWPDRSDAVLARLVGLGAVALALIAGWSAVRRRPIAWADLAMATVGLALGLGLLAAPADRSTILLGRVIGTVAILLALRLFTITVRGRDESVSKGWPLTQAGLLACLGLLLVAFPTELLNGVLFLFAVGWALLGVIAIAVSLDQSTPGIASYTDAGSLMVTWLEERPKDADDRRALYAKILYDGPTTSRRVIRFFSLMSFAAIIASTGVAADSTAVVIGAMLIAPLMTPLMGMAISLVMGWPVRLARSTAIAVAGIGLAILIGFLVGLMVPTIIDTATNTQILARTSPTTVDLIIALAAGAAGAYGLSRPDVSDSLPGVAIAISLVPPLTVVGITLSQGAFELAAGALLLFATNMIAILVMGGLVFVATGVTPVQRLADNQHRVRTSMAAIGSLALLVTGGLLLNGAEITRDLAETDDVGAAAESWLEPFPEHNLIEIMISGDNVVAVVLGPSDNRPTAQALADAVVERLDRSVTVDVRLVVEERDSATADPDG